MRSEEDTERLQNELDLLDAMYPEQCTYDKVSQEFKFKSTHGAVLKLRVLDQYPSATTVEIISATGPASNNSDMRNTVGERVKNANLTPGEEALDAIIGIFNDLLDDLPAPASPLGDADSEATSNSTGYMTVIIWLHHLLATSKRKAALSPPSTAVSGISKPGYPGVMVFSGGETAVREHVRELRGMKWQAFQVRLEEVHDESRVWKFEHGDGVVEVEAMGDVVKGVIGDTNKETVVKALGMR